MITSILEQVEEDAFNTSTIHHHTVVDFGRSFLHRQNRRESDLIEPVPRHNTFEQICEVHIVDVVFARACIKSGKLEKIDNSAIEAFDLRGKDVDCFLVAIRKLHSFGYEYIYCGTKCCDW